MMGEELCVIAMAVVFIVGYFLITIEHITQINKATIALMIAVLCWLLEFSRGDVPNADHIAFLGEHVASISEVIFFLLGALTVVELISVHNGFHLVSRAIHTTSKRKLLWAVGMLTFFLTPVFGNITTTIVMISIVRKLLVKSEERLLIGGAVVIAANAGGVWSPIGDITTTMLWIGGQLTTAHMLRDLFLPSLVCVLASLGYLSLYLDGYFSKEEIRFDDKPVDWVAKVVFWLGIGCLVFVPIFKVTTGMPPFMGILLGLSVLWLVTDLIHCQQDDREHLRVHRVLSRIDLAGVLFFLGILLAIDALETAGILDHFAVWLKEVFVREDLITIAIGVISAIVDNVPLVAASMSMYDLSIYPTDSYFWEMIAYCAGTGGSLLIIGSAAGVVFMGLEKANFYWYMKRLSIPALIGFIGGILTYSIGVAWS